MDSYTSEWNKETVMANATRLLHITQELAVDAVPKYTKKQYARLGFGAASLSTLTEDMELALVQEAYTIAWKYLNLTLEYTPIAVTTMKLHTHHGLLGDFIGTVVQDNTVIHGDSQGTYTCASTGSDMSRWFKPRNARVSTYPNYTTVKTGRVLTGTRTSTVISGWPTDLDAMTDVERMSLEEPTSIRLNTNYWWLTWYPKQQYMMIHRTEYSNDYCNPPSEVTWSYRVAPSSYRHFVYQTKDWQVANNAQAYTIDFRTQYPRERHQTDYAYEVRNDRGGFEWVEIKGTLPVYKCPPMLLKYFQDSFPHVQFESDSSLEENNLYSEILNSIEDPKNVSGYVLWESATSRTTMFYTQAEFYSIPLHTLFPVHLDTFYTRPHTFPTPRQHSSGQQAPNAFNSPVWVYVAKDHPAITRSYPMPPLKLYVGEVEYKLSALIDPARNASGLVLYPNFGPFLLTSGTGAFDDTIGFYLNHVSLLGVRYTVEGEPYAICVVKSTCMRDWTHPYGDYATVYPLNAQVINHQVSGVDWSPLNKFITYSGGRPSLDLPRYKFYVQLDGRPHPSGIGGTTGKDLIDARLLRPDDGDGGLPYANFRAYVRESSQYQYMLNTPTGNSGFYKPDLPADTYTFISTKELFGGS